MTDELKACPFCGEAEALMVDFSTATHRWTVWCSACDSGTFHSQKREESIAAWNKRAREAELEALVAKMGAALNKIAGSHWERVGRCQTDIEDTPDLTAIEAMQEARAILADPQVREIMEKQNG